MIEQVLQTIQPNQAYFWATHSGAEIDLVFHHQGKKFGVEVKFNEAPKITASMRTALSDLGLEHLWIVYPGPHRYPVDEQISAWPLQEITKLPVAISKG